MRLKDMLDVSKFTEGITKDLDKRTEKIDAERKAEHEQRIELLTSIDSRLEQTNGLLAELLVELRKPLLTVNSITDDEAEKIKERFLD